MSAAGLTVYGAPEGYDALLIARRRAETEAPVLHVCRDDARMARVAEALAFWAPGIEVLRFPAWDCLPYDRVSPNPEIVAERVATLTRLLEPAKAGRRVVVTTVNALVQKVPPREVFRGATMQLRKGGRVQPEKLVDVEKELPENEANLLDLANRYLTAIQNSLNQVPPELRRISAVLQNMVKPKYPNSVHTVVGGFFFLRLVCPAIVSPEGFGVVDGS